MAGNVRSPAYAIIHEYEDGTLPFRHADLYRVESAAELVALALDERVGVEGVWLVEWGSRFPQIWPSEQLRVSIEITGETRLVSFVAIGARHASVLGGLTSA